MRRVVTGLFMSLDGVVEAPNQWQFDNFDEGVMAAMGSQISGIDTSLLGRVTYREWQPYWPTSKDEPFASFINNTPKYVVSTTLDEVSWGQFDSSTLIKEDIPAEITKLKQQAGGDIGIAGSPTLVRSLLGELSVLVMPGSGTGELAGLEGKMSIEVSGGEHRYTLEYSFDEDALAQ